MTLDSTQTLFLTLAFIVPGFVIDSVFSMFIPRPRSESYAAFLRYLTFSCLNYAVFSWLLYLLAFLKPPLAITLVSWILVTLLGPVLLALVLGYAYQNRWPVRFARKLNLRIIHTAPTAWDYIFSTTKPSFVLVVLTGGTKIRGLYAGRSFSSSDPSQRDVYIEQACRLQGETWRPLASGASVLVTSRNIEYIEFIPVRSASPKNERGPEEGTPERCESKDLETAER